jgi:predicted permease
MSFTIAWQSWLDLRYAVRSLRAKPGFTIVAAATMALGIGVNMAVFTLVNAVLFRPTPVGDPKSLYELTSPLDTAEFSRFRQSCLACDEVAAFTWVLPAMSDSSEGEIVHGNEVSANYFRAMRVRPALGRFLRQDDYRDLAGHAIVLNYEFWRQRFQADNAVIGRSLKLSGRAYTVVGVAPPQFIGTMPLVAKFWALLPPGSEAEKVRVLVRAKPGMSAVRIEEELTALRRHFNPSLAGANRDANLGANLGANRDADRVRLQSRANLIPLNPSTGVLAALLMGCVSLVLLIACANVTNLVLARSADRRREIALRIALGASRERLLRLLITESIVLSGLGGSLALLVTSWTLPAFAASIQSRMPRLWGEWTLHLNPDLRVFAYTGAASVAAALLIGFVPALMATRLDVSVGLKDGGNNQGIQWSRSPLRSGLVVIQVALCLVLLINAGLLARSLSNAYTGQPGFDADRNLIVQFDIGRERDSTLTTQMLERLWSIPGVESVAAGRMVPLLGSGHGSVSPRAAERGIPTGFNRVSSTYFSVLGVPIVRGRSFTKAEENSNASVAVLSDAAARKLFPRESPLGKAVSVDGFLAGEKEPRLTAIVIGVVRDTRSMKLAEVDAGYVYLPLNLSRASDTVHYFVRARGDAMALLPTLRQTAAEMSRGHQVLVYPFDIAIGYQRLPAQAGGFFSGVLGLLSMLLATVGIYGVVSFSVSQRTREIGIRIALGATAHDITAIILRQGMRLVAIGVVAGVGGAVPLAWLLRSIMLGVSPLDPATFLAASGLLAAIALFAMWIPTRRASHLQPLDALRHE